MREEEGARYLSPLVKQDLAKLDTDGDTRRLAVKSLKLFVEQLDTSTLPRFISQIAESREPGATRCYAISLYEEVARVHGKLVVPHISKVMAALVRSSSASGSFPQLQVACARVTAALARHGIDATTSQDEAEEIMREICTPLIDALSGKLEPVAATAAACIHALAATEKWKYAREEIVHDVCQRTTVALSEKSTRTAAHMQLIRVLASANPDVLNLHGASLLRAGEEILKATATPWQLRKAAAQLLQSVLTILDKETLETELNSALHALDSCRLDRMPHVRAAVSEALHTAKMLASGNSATHTSFGMAASPIRKTRSIEYSDRPSPWLHDDHAPVSPVSKRGTSPRAPMSPMTSTFSPRAVNRSPRAASPTSQESRRLSFSSASTSTSESVQAPRRSGARAKRAPLYPARGMGYNVHSPRSSGTPGTSPSSSTTAVEESGEECESPSRRLNFKEFNVQIRSTVPASGHVFPGGKDEAGHGENFLRPHAPLTSGAFTPLLPTQLDTLVVETIPKLKEALLELTRDSKIILPAEDSGLAQFVAGFEKRPTSSSGHTVEVVLPRLKLGGINSLDHQHSALEHSSGERTPMLKASSISLQTVGLTNDSEVARNCEDASSQENESACIADVEVEKRQIFVTPEPPIREPELHGSPLQHYLKPFAYVDVNLEFEEKRSTKDFLPFVTPKRLVRSLSNLSIPESRGSSMLEQDMKLSHYDDELSPSGMQPGNAADAETASETGWSVRDNPIASEESYRAESSDEETDNRRCRGAYESSPSSNMFADSCSPREIRMISPSKSLHDGAATLHRGAHSADAEAEHPCPSYVVAEQTCRVRIPAKDMDVGKSPSGLSSLLHEDEMNTESANLSSSPHQFLPKCSEACSEEADLDPRRSLMTTVTHTVTHSWKKLCWYTETALGGSLCLVIALPLAMLVAKALNGSRGEYHHLVPT